MRLVSLIDCFFSPGMIIIFTFFFSVVHSCGVKCTHIRHWFLCICMHDAFSIPLNCRAFGTKAGFVMLLIHKLHLYLLCTKCCFSCLQFCVIQNRFLSSTAFVLKLSKYTHPASETYVVGLMFQHLRQGCLCSVQDCSCSWCWVTLRLRYWMDGVARRGDSKRILSLYFDK